MNEVNDGLPEKQRTLAIITVILAVVISVLDGSIANLALPSIAVDMQATASEAIWIINSYQIAMAICLLPLASLGEIIGYRRIYMTGLALFTVASLACSVSGTMLELSLARVLQGIGAAGILSVNVALLRFIYPRRLMNSFFISLSCIAVCFTLFFMYALVGLRMHMRSDFVLPGTMYVTIKKFSLLV